MIGLLTLGHIVSLSHLLDPRENLDEGLLKGVNAERVYLESEFLRFQKSYSDMFTLEMREQTVDPKAGLFEPLLLQLLITIIKYKKRMGNTFDDRISVQSLFQGFQDYLRRLYPHLEPLFLADFIKQPKDIPYLEEFKWSESFKVVYTGYRTQNTSTIQGVSVHLAFYLSSIC